MSGPTFLCIGPEKTGTSWLYKQLVQHPDIFLPVIKEVRYFWEKDFLPNNSIFQRLTADHWHYNGRRRDWLRALRSLEMQKLYWLSKFLFLPHTDSWYLSLFDESYSSRGDITPIYYRVGDKQLDHITKTLPDVKVIMLFRYPVERTWSRAKMVLCHHRGKHLTEITREEFLNFFHEDVQDLPSYVDIYKRWIKHIPAERIFVGYYDQLLSEPVALLENIVSFLAIKFERFPKNVLKGASQRVNVGVSGDIPAEYALHLARVFRQCVDEMSEINCPYASEWKNKNELLLAHSTET